jgi:ribosomal-protein-alanine N-acetyltransferase
MKTGGDEIRIRALTAADLDCVTEIGQNVSEAPHWPRWAYEAVLDPDFPRRLALVAEARATGAILGFAVASILPPEAELESIAVSAAQQRRGIGRELLEAMMEQLRAAKVREAHLEVRASNQRALDFYRVLGWIETGRRPRYYADPEEDAVVMNLALR